MKIGTTFSHRHSQHLRIPLDTALSALLSFGFAIIRLGCYWDEIEKESGTYDFASVIPLLEQCEKAGQAVVMTIGMKAPRWPEYYFPAWLEKKHPQAAAKYILPYIEACIKILGKYRCITYWQIENEPLDPSGPEELAIPSELLQLEVRLVKHLDKRPVVVNLWGNELRKRKLLAAVPKEADIIGLDLYYKVPLIGRLYCGPNDSDATLQTIIAQSDKPVWISELQAEPWESNVLVANTSKTPSMSVEILRKNFDRASNLQPDAIFLWGFEYWLMKQQKGDPSLWNAAKKIVEENTKG